MAAGIAQTALPFELGGIDRLRFTIRAIIKVSRS
jgi:hypothetical protein